MKLLLTLKTLTPNPSPGGRGDRFRTGNKAGAVIQLAVILIMAASAFGQGPILPPAGPMGSVKMQDRKGVYKPPVLPVAGEFFRMGDSLYYKLSTGIYGVLYPQTAAGGYEHPLTFRAPIARTVDTISIAAASASTDGYLTSSDWLTFDAKEPAITPGTTSQYWRGDKTWVTLPTVDSTNFVRLSRTLTVAATLPLSSSAGAQDLSANRTWTLSVVKGAYGVTSVTGTGYATATGDTARVVNVIKGAGGITSVSASNGLTASGDTAVTVSGVNAAADGSTKGVAAFASTDFNSSLGVLSLDYVNGQAASGSVNGFLSSTDWTTFNGKEPAIASGTTAQYWRGDKTWVTLPTVDSTNFVRLSRTLTIAATSPLASSAGAQDLSANRTWTLSIADAAADGSTKGASTYTAADFNSSVGVISIDYSNGQASSASAKGFLTSTDWSTFNNKQNALTTGTLSATSPVAVSGARSVIGGAAVISITDAAADGSTKGAATFAAADFNASSGVLSLDYANGQASSASVNGFLSSTDWSTFNAKEAAISAGTTAQYWRGDKSWRALASDAVTGLTGTTNQVSVSASVGSVTLSLPQSIATTSTPQFAGLGIGVAAPSTSLEIDRAAANADASAATFKNSNSTSGLTLRSVSMTFQAVNGDGKILAGNETSGSGADGFLAFYTRASESLAEKFRIRSTGNLVMTGKIDTYNNSAPSNGQLLIGSSSNFSAATLTGTSNQVVVTNGANSVTLSTPQDIGTSSSPSFASVTTSGRFSNTGTAGDVSSPVDGDSWYNTTQKAYRMQTTAGTLGIVGLLYVNTSNSNTVSNTVTETAFNTTYSLPANSLTAGKVIRITAWGTYGCTNATPTMQINLYAGSAGTTAMLTGVNVTHLNQSVTNGGWKYEAVLVVRTTGSSGTCMPSAALMVQWPSGTLPWVGHAGSTTINTTTANVLTIDAKWGTANSSNTITIESMMVEALN